MHVALAFTTTASSMKAVVTKKGQTSKIGRIVSARAINISSTSGKLKLRGYNLDLLEPLKAKYAWSNKHWFIKTRNADAVCNKQLCVFKCTYFHNAESLAITRTIYKNEHLLGNYRDDFRFRKFVLIFPFREKY